MKSYNVKLKIIFLAILFFGIFGLAQTTNAERFFQQMNTWYDQIPNDPVFITHSSDYITSLNAYYPNLVIMGSGDTNWSVPIYQATGGESTYSFDTAACAAAHPEWCQNIPIPTGALPAGNIAACGGAYRDGHMVIISADGNYVWDFFRARYCESVGIDGDEDGVCETGETCYWYAYIIRRWDLTDTGVSQPYDGFRSCRVARVPLLQGLITYDEVVNHGEINHAIAMYTAGRYSTSSTDLYKSTNSWFPTYQTQGYGNGPLATANGLSLGMRLQLDPTYDCSLISNVYTRMVCVALQKYGMIYVENTGVSGGNGVYVEDLTNKPESWVGILPGTLGIGISNFRVVDPICSDSFWCPENLVSASDTTPPSAPTGLSVQ